LVDALRGRALGFAGISPSRVIALPKKTSPHGSALPDFEAALAELEKIVERMESGDQNLEEALASFQRGIELTRACQKGLKEAEQRVEKLVQEGGETRTEPFAEDASDSGEDSGTDNG
jgi:exodeoxyribonuclease VII small subunit